MPTRFIPGKPKEGTPTLGVVFYVLHENEIIEATAREPIGYVIEEEATDDDKYEERAEEIKRLKVKIEKQREATYRDSEEIEKLTREVERLGQQAGDEDEAWAERWKALYLLERERVKGIVRKCRNEFPLGGMMCDVILRRMEATDE
jgi:hypothetical protein